MKQAQIITGDCREVMAGMDAESVDSIVTDPPYGLSFMGKGWDKGVPGVEFWVEALRVAKPGTHLLAFGGTRMVHRLAVAIEDAGWEIRDRIHWVYGSGFPKSHDVSKAIDKAAGAERVKIGAYKVSCGTGEAFGKSVGDSGKGTVVDITAPATTEAQQWHGWGTALKPAVEPIILARKPFKGTVAANVLEHGTGAINVDGCRVSIFEDDPGKKNYHTNRKISRDYEIKNSLYKIGMKTVRTSEHQQGRWPANLIHDGSDEATAGMGEAARYFYCPKASKKDRGADNKHPTVKPTDLMAYLCRLVTPPGGLVLDPFNGSGSTGKAAVREGFRYIGIEQDQEYADIARERLRSTTPSTLF
jgi:DNA modification methylase